MEISIQDLIDRVEKGEDVNNVVSEALDSMPPEQSNVSDDNAAKDIKSVVTNPDSTDDKKDKDKTITDKPSLKLVVDNNPYVYDIIDENKELFKDCIITSSSDLKQKTIECPDEDTLSKVTELLKQYIVDDSDNKSTEVSKEPVNSDAIKEVNPTEIQEPKDVSYTFKGINDFTKFKSELDELISKYSGVIVDNEEGK